MARSSGTLFLFIKRLTSCFSPSCILLRRECNLFGRHLEKEYFPKASAEGIEITEWEIVSRPESLRLSSSRPQSGDLPKTLRLARFLSSVGLKKLSLDVRLESNQIVDIFVMLHGVSSLLKGRGLRRMREPVGSLYTGEGLKMYCAEVRIQPAEATLIIRYSYCQLMFSNAVTAFKRRSKIFKDHRSFFYAAPRYGALIGLAVILFPLALHFFLPGYEILILSLVGFLIGVLTYLLFQTIGSIEYDKEEQAQQILKANRSLQEKQWLIDQDLEKAAQIQKRILPGDFFQIQGLEIAALLKPQSQVGGDFYDFWETPQGHIHVILVDCVGHGLFSALIAAAIKSVFLSSQGDRASEADRLISSVQLVLKKILPMGFFAALTFLDLDPKGSKAALLNAGNPFPLLVHQGGGLECLNQASYIPLGIPVQDEFYKTWEFSFQKGEKIILYTDGIVEARDQAGREYTEDRLRRLAEEGFHLKTAELRDLILRDNANFSEGLPPSDDQTLLVIQA